MSWQSVSVADICVGDVVRLAWDLHAREVADIRRHTGFDDDPDVVTIAFRGGDPFPFHVSEQLEREVLS